MNIKVQFVPYDFWVGFFWDGKRKLLYQCPLPMLAIQSKGKASHLVASLASLVLLCVLFYALITFIVGLADAQER